MIYYTISNWNVFRMKGSVFPTSTRAAFPCALFGAMIRWAINKGFLDFLEADDSILTQTQAWAGFSVLVGFLIIFRSSQAYSRFWDGCTATHHMRADWFDACSVLISFTELSKAPVEKIAQFKHMLIRLVSMMHSAALMDLEEMNNTWGTVSDVKADQYELLDPEGLDADSLVTLKQSRERVSLLFQWIQLLIVHNMEAGVLAVPPPILSRAYQELASGMVAFHECVKISDTPFPFPYAQNCELLLCLHWVLVPFVVSQWVTQPFWSFIFVFMQVFVLWSLNYLAAEIENPFGTDDNSIDGFHMQEEMNRHLLLLLDPKTLKLPHLSERAVFSVEPDILPWDRVKKKTFHDIWFAKPAEPKKKKKRGKQTGTPASDDDDDDNDSDESREDMELGLPLEVQDQSLSMSSPLRQEARSARPAECHDSGGEFPPPLGMRGSWTIMEEAAKINGGARSDLEGSQSLDQTRWSVTRIPEQLSPRQELANHPEEDDDPSESDGEAPNGYGPNSGGGARPFGHKGGELNRKGAKKHQKSRGRKVGKRL